MFLMFFHMFLVKIFDAKHLYFLIYAQIKGTTSTGHYLGLCNYCRYLLKVCQLLDTQYNLKLQKISIIQIFRKSLKIDYKVHFDHSDQVRIA